MTETTALAPRGPRQLAVMQGTDLVRALRGFGLAGPAGGSIMGGGFGFGDRMPERLEDPSRQDAWIFSAIDFLCSTCTLAKFEIVDGDPDDKDAKVVTSGPDVDLFAAPNRFHDQHLYLTSQLQNIMVSGESFEFMVDAAGQPIQALGTGDDRSRVDLPAALWPLSGSMIRMNPDRNGYPDTWEAPRVNGKTQPFKDAAVVQNLYKPDDRRPFRGLGPMAAAVGVAAQQFLARRFQSVILQNDGRTGGLIIIGGYMTEAERERQEADLNRNWNNGEAAGEDRILEGDAKYQELNRTPRDLEYAKLLEENKRNLEAVFGTPGALFGANQVNYATFAGHFRRYIELQVAPRLQRIASSWNRQLFSRLREPSLARHRCRFNLSELRRIVGDITEQASAISTLTRSGVPLDEAMQATGISTDGKIVGGEVSFVNQAQVPLQAAAEIGWAKALEAKAKAAEALQRAGVDLEASLAEAGISAKVAEQEEEPELGPEDEGGGEGADPATGDDQGDDGEGPDGMGTGTPGAGDAPPVPGSASLIDELLQLREASEGDTPRSPKVLPAGYVVEKEDEVEPPEETLSSSKRAELAAVVQKSEGAPRAKLLRGVKRVFHDMRKAQLRALEQFAKEGRVDREAEGMEVRALYDGAIPTTSSASWKALLRALREDREETAQAREAGTLETREVVSCCTVRTEEVEVTRRADRWLKAHPRARALGVRRLEDLAILHARDFSEADIDRLIVVGSKKWTDELAGRMEDGATAAWKAGAHGLGVSLGVSAPRAVPPEVLESIGRRALRVAEGSSSAVARKLRTVLLRALNDHGSLGDVQTAVRSALEEMNAATTGAFNTLASRAQTIARTEVGRSVSDARIHELERLKREGIVSGWTWRTSGRGPVPLGTVRASHYTLEGSEIDGGVVRYFVSGAGNSTTHPRAFGIPGEDINCECFLQPNLAPE